MTISDRALTASTICELLNRSLTARNVSRHKKALQTVEKLSGSVAADQLGLKIGASTNMEEFAKNITSSTPFFDMLMRKEKLIKRKREFDKEFDKE